ncbi:DUF3261 domain-containing protein [Photobacterium swingsii]|uniref:DUF3261 domain-containing protein n=1 Tax=Photobacterium swingsii TaxID=680026 RepID=UPI0040689290
MILSRTIKPFSSALCAALLLSALSGCSSQPQQQQTNLIEIAPNVSVTIPTPEDLGYRLTASQLIGAQWGAPAEQKQQQQLPVQLEVDPNKVALAGFSSWGARILTLSYQNQMIEASVLTGLETALPKPEQVLFNLMITLWPIESWQPHLAQIGWRLTESKQQRQLFDATGELVADIHYSTSSIAGVKTSAYLDGLITFNNRQLGYTITIKTLNHTQQAL